jgi:hypothetical protein
VKAAAKFRATQTAASRPSTCSIPWLMSELSSYRDRRLIFLFFHHPRRGDSEHPLDLSTQRRQDDEQQAGGESRGVGDGCSVACVPGSAGPGACAPNAAVGVCRNHLRCLFPGWPFCAYRRLGRRSATLGRSQRAVDSFLRGENGPRHVRCLLPRWPHRSHRKR